MARRRRRKKLPQGLFQAEISSLSHEGRGIAQVNGKTTFIDNALPNEIVEFSFTGSRAKFAEGIAEVISNPSDERVTPQCNHFGYCGGCSMQHMSPEAQLAHKQAVLIEQFEHLGKVKPETILSPLSGPVWGYRHKARLAVKHVIKKEKTLVGFREKRSPFVADINSCEVLHPKVGKKLNALADLIMSLNNHDQIPQIEVAISETETALVIRHLTPLNSSDIERLRSFQTEHECRLYLQPGGYDTVHCLDTDDNLAMQYHLPEYDLNLSFLPTDFTQINVEINQRMISLAINHLELNANDRVLDLFCGIGNFTLPMATIAKQVSGVEGDAGLIARAQENARINDLNNVEFHVADLAAEELIYPFMSQQYNKLLLDPARTGAKEIISALNLKEIELIVYVSCNPATLARDAGILVNEKGYRLRQAGIMDMFPRTSHVESIAVFHKQ
ncbi:MAG: 23S rRNA (uracil(1939)-C(5))-methyltransferase RlmD [Pseudomonadota bacterium]